MVAISPEKNGYWPPIEARNQFSVSYPGEVLRLQHPPLHRFTDQTYLPIKQAAEEQEYTPPQKYSQIIPQSEYTLDLLGELIHRWDGDGRSQEVMYFDESNNPLHFNTTSHEDMATRLRIRHVIRKLKYYRVESLGDISIIHRDETVAEVHTYITEINNKLTELAKSANSEPQLYAVGATHEELESHLKFINRFFSLSAEARILREETETHLSQGNPIETPYSDAVTELFIKAKEAVENRPGSN